MDYIDRRIAHLTTEQIDKLMLEYYMDRKVSDLIEEYNIDVPPQSLYKIFPPMVSKDEFCPYCNIALMITRPSKTSFSESKKYCQNCGHEHHQYCKCSNCNKEKQRILDEKLQCIKEVYSLDKYDSVKLEDIGIRERVYLGALLRVALSEDMKYIVPFKHVRNKLSPRVEYDTKILSHLYKNYIILVDPTSDIEAFPDNEEDNNFPKKFNMFKVKYRVNVDFGNTYEEGISLLMNPTEYVEHDKVEAINLWKEISLQECLGYLEYQMKGVGFNFNCGEKTTSVFTDMLENFSASQVFGIIYRCVANATKYYQENNINRNQAANSVIGGCQRYAERSILNNWNLTRYRRHEPETIISEVFFNRIIQIGYLGFDMPPVDI